MVLTELSRKIKIYLFNMITRVLRGSAKFKTNTAVLTVGEVVYLDNEKSTDNSEDTLILLHGLGADKDAWLQFDRHLSKNYRIVIPDLPGHGQSVQKSSLKYSVEAQAQCISELIDYLRIKRAHIVGNSMGGEQLQLDSSICSQRLCHH